MSTMSIGRFDARLARASATSGRVSTAWPDPVPTMIDVGSADRLGQTVEPDGHTVDAIGERRAALGRAVGDEDLGPTGPAQGDGDAVAHRTGTDDQDTPAGQIRPRRR